MADELVANLNELFNQCQPDENDVADVARVLEVLTNSQDVCDLIDEQVARELGDLFVNLTDGLIARADFISRIQRVYPARNSTSSSSSQSGLSCSTPPSESVRGDDAPWLRRRSIFSMSSFSSAEIQPLDSSESPTKDVLANLERTESRNKRLQDNLRKYKEACCKMANDHEIELAVMARRLDDAKVKIKSLKDELKLFGRKAETVEALEVEIASARRKIEQLKDDLAKNKMALTEARDGIYCLTEENADLKKRISELSSQLRSEEQLLSQIEQLRADKQTILQTYSDNAASAIPNFVEVAVDNLEITPDRVHCIERLSGAGGHASISEELSAMKSNFLTARDESTMCDIPQRVLKHTQTLPPEIHCVASQTFCPTNDMATLCHITARRVNACTQTHQPNRCNRAVQGCVPDVHQTRFSFRRILFLIFVTFFCLVFVKNPWTSRLNLIVCQGITDFFRKSIGYRPHPY